MELQVALIGLIGTLVLSATGFITVMYQVMQGRKENSTDHNAVMNEIVSVSRTLGGVEKDVQLVSKKLTNHIKEHNNS